MELNNSQKSILKLFKDKFSENSMEIACQKTRISFKNGRNNYFILFKRKEGFKLHLNQRKHKVETLPTGFSINCFNQAVRYLEKDIFTIDSAIITITQIEELS